MSAASTKLSRLFSWRPILALAALAPLASGAREISTLSVDTAVGTVSVEFAAGEEGDGHVLYYAWSNDGQDKGGAIASWPNVVRLGRIGDSATSTNFPLPSAASVTGLYASRAFLATSSCAYDNLVEGVQGGTAGGKVYFETGVPPSPTTAIVVDGKYNATDAQQYIFGIAPASGVSYNTVLTFAAYINGSTQWASALQDKKGDWQTTGVAADTSRHTFFLDAASKVFQVKNADGTVVASSTHTAAPSITSASSFTIALFARRTPTSASASSVSGQGANATIYSCAISNGNALVRNYLPAVKDGVAGLYDTVNNTFAGAASGSLSQVGDIVLTYEVDAGDAAVGASPAFTVQSTDYSTETPYTEGVSIVSTTGGTKDGAAPLVLAGNNNWGGAFTVNEGALIADFAVAAIESPRTAYQDFGGADTVATRLDGELAKEILSMLHIS